METAPQARLSVLVVDDDADTAETTVQVLNLHGYRATTAIGAAEAAVIAAADPPDVVLSDLAMPGVDGFALARQLRDAIKPPVLVAVTGCGSDEDRRRAVEAGFDLHLLKPVRPALLVGLLRRVEKTLRNCPV